MIHNTQDTLSGMMLLSLPSRDQLLTCFQAAEPMLFSQHRQYSVDCRNPVT